MSAFEIYTRPPGLVGDIADYILNAAPRPVPHIALAGAIGLMAGVCGRAFNVSGTGLNLYVLLIAETGTGKEGIASGISSLIAAIPNGRIGNFDFLGPAEVASATRSNQASLADLKQLRLGCRGTWNSSSTPDQPTRGGAFGGSETHTSISTINPAEAISFARSFTAIGRKTPHRSDLPHSR